MRGFNDRIDADEMDLVGQFGNERADCIYALHIRGEALESMTSYGKGFICLYG